MKILQINSVCGIRSTGRIAAELADKYNAQGHECIIAYGREEVPEKYKKIAVRIGNEKSVKKNALMARIFDNEGFNAKKETTMFLEWADKFDPDLLWLHNLHGYYINIEMLFKWIKSRPHMKVNWLLHDCWAFTGHCSYFSLIECDQWQKKCLKCRQKHSYPSSLWKDNCKTNYERKRKAFCGVSNMNLITPSKWLADLVKKSFLGNYTIEVRNNTIDTNIFQPTSSSFRKNNKLEDKIIILGVASSWSKGKGLYDFIKLSYMLEEKYTIVLVGLTKKQISEVKRKTAKVQKQQGCNILCISKTNNTKELAAIYTAADAFLNLTYQDNYPTVNLEAQACGTPCLTYRTGGSVESVPAENIVEQGDLLGVIEWIKDRTR